MKIFLQKKEIFFKKVKIVALIKTKATILKKYVDYINMFFLNLAKKNFNHKKISDYFIHSKS